MKAKQVAIYSLCFLFVIIVFSAPAMAADPIKIAQITALSGPFEQFGNQSRVGFQMGLEYATKGTMELIGRPVEIILKDTQIKPAIGKQLLTEAYKDDNVDLAVGPTSSAVAMAMLPVPQEFKKILVVEPAVSDTITGKDSNRYVFKTSRNSSHDAIGNALVLARPGVSIATVAQDYTFGRTFVEKYKKAVEAKGAKIVIEEYLPIKTVDFTASAQRIIKAMKDIKGEKYLFLNWAGKGSPLNKFHSMKLEDKYGIKLSTGGNILPVLKGYKPFAGMEGSSYYYYGMVQNNAMNDWLIAEHQKRFKGAPPDFFTCGGFAAALFVATAITKAGSTDTEKLIAAMEGLQWMTPKGKMIMRKEDHQTLQAMFHFKLKVDHDVAWAVPELVKVQTIEALSIPLTR
ncbi:ABC transporter, substrate-binding protein (cluster 4, leucine/isoleucine/valine/benzoate) [Olavius sp. associated proteobacterium Delta 1]|nr:ABC transporter, substrate-binding protein (cluster 4, leucine/isoleucine/valine/benzoate) [Olavius sp. associated proteobacterium Delta 1]